MATEHHIQRSLPDPGTSFLHRMSTCRECLSPMRGKCCCLLLFRCCDKTRRRVKTRVVQAFTWEILLRLTYRGECRITGTLCLAVDLDGYTVLASVGRNRNISMGNNMTRCIPNRTSSTTHEVGLLREKTHEVVVNDIKLCHSWPWRGELVLHDLISSLSVPHRRRTISPMRSSAIRTYRAPRWHRVNLIIVQLMAVC